MLRTSFRRLSVVTLRARPPPNTAVTSACFTITNDAPRSPLKPNQLRCTTLLLSVDPFLRCRFNADPGVAYTSAYEIDAPIASAGLGVVTETIAEGFEPGDLVLEPFDAWPWADEVVLDASRVARPREWRCSRKRRQFLSERNESKQVENFCKKRIRTRRCARRR